MTGDVLLQDTLALAGDADAAAPKPDRDFKSRQEHGSGNGVQGSRFLFLLSTCHLVRTL